MKKIDIASPVMAKIHRRLKATQTRLLKARRPNPKEMPSYKLAKEYDLLARLAGTMFMTPKLHIRWERVKKEFSLRVAGGGIW